MKTISAYEARTNLGTLINRVFYNEEDVVIARKGKPMVRVTKYEDDINKDRFLKAAGSWSECVAEDVSTKITTSRNDNSKKLRTLLPWNK